jgi:preprotein translocase subunit SecE
VAKAVSNKQDKSGKGKADGRAGKGAKPPAKRTDTKPARKSQAARKGATGERRGFSKFLRDVRVEMGKVTWPTRRDLLQSTLVVLVAVAIAAVYTGALDFIFQRFVDVVLRVIT